MLFGNQAKPSKLRGESPGAISPSKKTPVPGRERLQHFSAGIKKAQEAIEDLQQRIDRFEGLIAGAQVAQKNLQAVIHADGGKTLSDFSSGLTNSNDPINSLVALAKTTREASIAAADALPYTREALDNARDQLAALETEKSQELNKVVARLADFAAEKYWQAFQTLGRLQDELIGYSNCAAQNLMAGEPIHVRLTTEPLTAPRFILPSLGSEDSDPELRYSPNHFAQEEAARKWNAVRERLDADDGANIDDLLKPKK
jgi:hypothetical protein